MIGGWGTLCSGQEMSYSPVQIKADIQFLHDVLKRWHPNLYLYSSKAEIDAAFTDLLHGVTDNMTTTECYDYVTQVSDKIKDGHTLFFPGDKTLEYHNEHSLFFPFKLFCFDGKLFVELNCSEEKDIENGAEILSINNVPSEEIINHCLPRMMRDGNDLKYPIWVLNNYFSEYYSYFFGHPKEFLIRYRTSTGLEQLKTVAALSKPAIRQNRSERYPGRATARGLLQGKGNGITLQVDRPLNAAVLTIRDFDKGILRQVYQQDFRKTIKVFFRQIEQSGVGNLVLDLRGNQGGDLANGIFLLSYILRQEFRAVERFYVVKNADEGADDERNGPKGGRGTRTFQPRPDAFKGNVYLLIDGGSFSNSAIVSSAFRFYKRGMIIGEETGGNKSVICGYERIVTLPNSKLSVHIPTRQFVIRGKDRNDGHGVLPDIAVQPTITGLINGRDEVMEAVLQLVNQ